MQFSDDFLTKLKGFEGNIGWMYLDTCGNVTVGVGHLLAGADDAADLPFDGGDPILSWHLVKAARPALSAGSYEAMTTARLTQDAVDALLVSDLNRSVNALAAGLPNFDALPQCVQEALCDMAFNLGCHKLLTEYPHMLQNIAGGNWDGAADQCHRCGIQDSRNDYTAGLFRSAAAPAPTESA